MIFITRKVEFDAAHRVIGHENKCKYLHGHRYVLEVSFSAKELDDLGRVIDFGAVKEVIKKWIDDNLDHTTILSKKDIELGEDISKHTQQKIYYLDVNPTAENIAIHLKNDIFPSLFPDSVLIHKIKLYETPNCSVEFES
ncbi:MAG: 6-carboxytetrahydropterin synthase [Rickettsiaceae bacterium]|nr:6-carboxytetrahydropterin synthase [Rickettsiaceae bacterium]